MNIKSAAEFYHTTMELAAAQVTGEKGLVIPWHELSQEEINTSILRIQKSVSAMTPADVDPDIKIPAGAAFKDLIEDIPGIVIEVLKDAEKEALNTLSELLLRFLKGVLKSN
ncbi:hypothetical protein BH10BAC5_BH10BAC5_16840 [soil metagenome]